MSLNCQVFLGGCVCSVKQAGTLELFLIAPIAIEQWFQSEYSRIGMHEWGYAGVRGINDAQTNQGLNDGSKTMLASLIRHGKY